MLSRMPRPSPALVVALITLVVAATGGAMAAIPDADGTVPQLRRRPWRTARDRAARDLRGRRDRPRLTGRAGDARGIQGRKERGGHVAASAGRALQHAPSPKAWVDSDFANCDLQAGADSDRLFAYAGNTLHANVVHRFTKPSRVVFRCGSPGAIIRMIEVATAIEVDQLTNTPTSS